MARLNPLERGILRDLLLKALVESGISNQTLTYLMGIDPATLSAVLIRATVDGSMSYVPGSDWASSQYKPQILIPRKEYTVDSIDTASVLSLDGPARWLLYWEAALGPNEFENYNMLLNYTVEGTAVSPAISIPLLEESAGTQPLLLPKCTLITSIEGHESFGAVALYAVLFPIPIGVC